MAEAVARELRLERLAEPLIEEGANQAPCSGLRSHAVQFYEDESYLCQTVTDFVAAGLLASDPVLVIATEPHRAAFERCLDLRCLNTERAVQRGDLVFLDAEETLSKFMLDGEPSWELFETNIGARVRAARARKHERPLRAYGEMVDVLWRQGNSRAAIRLEEMWNQLARVEVFSLLCGYALENFRSREDTEGFERICAAHSHTHPTERFSALGDDDAKLRQVALLQQRARSLQAEIQRREELEKELRQQTEQLRAREEELRDFVENGVEGIHWVGPDGTILFANQAELDLLGYSRDEYVGRHIREFHADDRVIGDILTRLCGGETIRDYEASLRCKDGSVRHVLINSNVYWRDGKFVHTRCFTRDITARKNTEQKLREQSLINENLVRIGSALSSELDLGALVQKVTDEATALCRAQFGAFFHNVINDKGESYMLYTLSGAPRELFANFPMPRNTPIFQPTFDGTGVVRLDDATKDPRYGKNEPHNGMPPGHLPVKSYLAVPVRSRSGEVLGGLFFGHAEPGVFLETDEAIIVAIAGQAAVALDNAKLLQAARKAEEHAKEERKKLEEIARELENANRMKDDFLATVSHELRTPLNAILGWVRMLRAGGLPDDKKDRALETIERNANAQTQLIEDLLDVSRIISGKLRLDVGSVDLPTVVENAIEAVRPAANARCVTLRQTMDPNAGPILGDPERLQQVVWNLLTNAVKFTPKGGSVHVAVQKQESSIEVIVADTGQGIDAEFLPRVFERFRQADATPSRKHGGLGLGLAIVRHLVELHGGTVKVESEGLGHGATFTVCLPISPLRARSLERPPALRMMATPTFERPEELEGVNVLVVDDEPDARELLSEMLSLCKARVTVAGSAAEALRLVEELRPDVIVSDIGMPEEDGYVLIQKLRALPEVRGGRTPAVALTAYTRLEDRTRALVAGFNMHVPKPVEPAELIAVLSSLTLMFTPRRAP